MNFDRIASFEPMMLIEFSKNDYGIDDGSRIGLARTCIAEAGCSRIVRLK